MHRVFAAGKSAEQIRKVLGQPTERVAFPQPRVASDVPELVSLSSFIRELPMETFITGYEDYQYCGNVYAPVRYQGYGMCGAMTFGVGEVIQFPWLVSYTLKEGKVVHRFRVWYRRDSTYFAHVWSDDYWAKEVVGWPYRWEKRGP